MSVVSTFFACSSLLLTLDLFSLIESLLAKSLLLCTRLSSKKMLKVVLQLGTSSHCLLFAKFIIGPVSHTTKYFPTQGKIYLNVVKHDESNVQLYQLVQRSPHQVRPSVRLMPANVSKAHAEKKKFFCILHFRTREDFKTNRKVLLEISALHNRDTFFRENCILL